MPGELLLGERFVKILVQFPLKATIAYSFCGRCKSIKMKPQGDELFTCIWTACSERKVGDQTK